jgi:integrase
LILPDARSSLAFVSTSQTVEQTDFILVFRSGTGDRVYCDAQWRYRMAGEGRWQLKKKRLGLAWKEPNGSDGWRKRRGRCPDGWLDDHTAALKAAAAMRAHAEELLGNLEAAREAAERKTTFRELAHSWLSWLGEVKGSAPSTLADYGYLLREPGTPYRHGNKTSPGRIMDAFGDRPAQDVTTREVSAFLRKLDKEGLTPRNVNKHREVLSSIFNYGCREDTFELPKNPVEQTDARFEEPPAALDYYEVHEVEALAGAAARGTHRWVPRLLTQLEEHGSVQAAAAAARVGQSLIVAEAEINPVFARALEKTPGALQAATDPASAGWSQKGVVIDPDELAARVQEDRRDAEAYRVLFYTGLRLGEVLALRIGDLDLDERLILVRRTLSGGKEKNYPKGKRHRFVPLSTPAVETLRRLLSRHDFVGPNDYVLCNRLGRRLDPSSLRRRYKRACAAAGLRPVKLHGLRHAAGSLIARTSDAVFVRDFLGHAKLTTTNRYLSSKLRPEEFERLDRAFGVLAADHSTGDTGVR